jgi:hypothetical protein
MEALKIDEEGWLYNLAKFGGLTDSRKVADRQARKENDLIRELYDKDGVKYDDYIYQLKPEWRDVNFCDFTRFVLKGVFISIAVFVFCLVCVAFVSIGTAGLLAPVLGFALHDRFWQGAQLVGCAEWGLFSFVLIWYGISKLWKYYREKRSYYVSTDEELSKEIEKLESKLEKRKLRAAFWQSIRSKTCFKVDFQ